MWPEDFDNDYSYMAAKQKYEQEAAKNSNSEESKMIKAVFGSLLKQIM